MRPCLSSQCGVRSRGWACPALSRAPLLYTTGVSRSVYSRGWACPRPEPEPCPRPEPGARSKPSHPISTQLPLLRLSPVCQTSHGFLLIVVYLLQQFAQSLDLLVSGSVVGAGCKDDGLYTQGQEGISVGCA